MRISALITALFERCGKPNISKRHIACRKVLKMNIQWDAEKYTDDFSFVHRYGDGVTGLLENQENMTVLDLGCGNGALTEKLSQTCARAIGLDASAELLKIARRKYPDLKFIQADATNFELPGPVDAIFSNAVFHWVDAAKQPDMLRCVYRALKPGGQFVFEFGGCGNNRLIHMALEEAFAKRGLPYRMPFYFPTIGAYSALLEQAGFKVVSMTLFDRMTELKGPDGLADWIRLFVKRPFGELSEDTRREIVEEAVNALKKDLYRSGVWFADYVRLRGKALKA